MPTIWSERGFEFMIHTNDHEPVHVHAYKAGGVALINVVDLELRKVINMKKQDVRLAMRIIATQREFFLREWKRIHQS
jgi:hypothetical protein